MRYVKADGEPVLVGRGRTANDNLSTIVQRVIHGVLLGDVSKLIFRDPAQFRAGELHSHLPAWEQIVGATPSPQQQQVLKWIQEGVSVHPYFQHFRGRFKGKNYDSDLPPPRIFKNNTSCRPFVSIIQHTLIDRVKTGAISLLGHISKVPPPHLVLPLTMETTKPRLCQDARFLNQWMKDMPFVLDKLIDLPRYVSHDTYQTVLDDKSGYDHLFMTSDSSTYFGFQWGGWYFVYRTLPFGWKISRTPRV